MEHASFWNACVADPSVSRVLLICKSHLDIGFTDFSATVKEQYLTQFIPRVIRTARQLQSEAAAENLVWNAGSWIIYEYWRRVRGVELQEFEAALADGLLAYHALPFTVHSEFFDAPLFASLLGDCRELDAAFGRRTRAAKMTDVPGHSCGIVPLLADGGVEFLHWGINPASYAPELPPLFRWRVADREIVVMYAGKGYSADATLPDRHTRVAFLHGGDNSSPPGIGMIRQAFRELRLQYPNATVKMGSLPELADAVLPWRETLPVVESEIGDSWIHGVATDCVKSARFRSLLRFRRQLPTAEIPREFDRNLALVGEHTWGMDIKTHLGDDTHWQREDFEKVRRSLPNFARVEASWQEQRAYLDAALAALPEPRRREAEAQLTELTPVPWDFSRPLLSLPEIVTDHLRARFDAAGRLVQLSDPAGARDYGSRQEPFLAVKYHRYGHADVMRYLQQYCPWDGSVTHVAWGAWDMGKIGLADDIKTGEFEALSEEFAVDDSAPESIAVRVRLHWPETLHREAGAPRVLEIEYRFFRHEPELDVTLQWFDKPADRVPEAIMAHFAADFTTAAEWRVGKLGLAVNPSAVVPGGGTLLHAVDDEASLVIREKGYRMLVDSTDAPLLLAGDGDLWHYRARAEKPAGKFAFCLTDNQWGTNFPQWCEDDFRCRFKFCWKPA